jgi:hypothetical protein
MPGAVERLWWESEANRDGGQVKFAVSLGMLTCGVSLLFGQQPPPRHQDQHLAGMRPTISASTMAALASEYGPAFAHADFVAGRFSPDGSMLALRISVRGVGADAIWLYELGSHRILPVIKKPDPYASIADMTWAEAGTLYVRSTAQYPIYWAATMSRVQENADPPAEVLQKFEREREVVSGSYKRQNARYTVWLEHHLHGSLSLLVSLKNQRGVRLLADASWELESYLFDAERSTVLYPVSHVRIRDGADGHVIVERLGGEIIMADLRTLDKRSLLLPNAGDLRLLDQTRDAHRIAYVVAGSCFVNDSRSNIPRNVCFAYR